MMRHYLSISFILGLFCAVAIPTLADTPDEQLAAASAQFGAKHYADAAQKLDGFVTNNPKHPKFAAAVFTLGRCRTELKQYPQAIAAYEKAAATKEPAVMSMAELGLGEAAIYAKQYEKAAKALEIVVKEAKLKPDQEATAWFWLGQADYQLQKYPNAELAYNKIIQDFSSTDLIDGAYYGLGLTAMKQNKSDAAHQAFKTVYDRFPKSEDRPHATLYLAQLDFKAKKYPEAKTEFESLLKNFASTDDGQKLQAVAEDGLIQTLLEMKAYNAAVGRLESALKRLPDGDPQRFRAQLNLGHCRYRLKDYDLAYDAYLEASRSPEAAVSHEGLYWASNSALANKKYSEAATQFSKFVTKYPKDELAAKAQLRAGDSYLNAKQNDEASAAYHAVINKYPQSPEAKEAEQALAELVGGISDPAKLAAALKTAPIAERPKGMLRVAKLYLAAKNEAESLAALNEVLLLKPTSDVEAETQYLRGQLFENQQKTPSAVNAYAESIRLESKAARVSDIQGRLAWLYLETKQPAKAEAAASAVLADNPAPQAAEQARLAQVQSQLDQQKWDLALEGCKSLLANNPTPDTIATVLFTQAWVKEKQDKPEEALALWERLASEFPKSDYAPQAFLRLGDSLLKAKKLEDAISKYKQLYTDFPKSPFASEAHYKQSTSLFNLDKFTEAAAQFDIVSNDKKAGDYIPESLYWAGVSYEKSDKKEEAISRLSKLVDQYPKHNRVTNAKIRLAALKAVK